MPMTFAPIFAAMNEEFIGSGRSYSALTTGLDGYNFSRLSAEPHELDYAFGAVRLGLRAQHVAIPRGFAPEAGAPLVNLYAGPGYTGDDQNPNPEGMGIVTSEAGVAIAVTFADAPSATIAHPAGVIAAVSGIWHQLPNGTVRETIELMRHEVEDVLNDVFRPEHLFVNISAGAREDTFLLDERVDERLLVGDCARYGHRVIRVFGQKRRYGLDLSGLFYEMWRNQGIPRDQITFDARNCMTARNDAGHLVLPSKRTSEESGNDSWKSAVHAIVRN